MRNYLVKATALLCPIGKTMVDIGGHQQNMLQILKQLQTKLNQHLAHHYTQTLQPSLPEQTSKTIVDAPPFRR